MGSGDCKKGNTGVENCTPGIPLAHTQAVADSTSTTFKPEILSYNLIFDKS